MNLLAHTLSRSYKHIPDHDIHQLDIGGYTRTSPLLDRRYASQHKDARRWFDYAPYSLSRPRPYRPTNNNTGTTRRSRGRGRTQSSQEGIIGTSTETTVMMGRRKNNTRIPRSLNTARLSRSASTDSWRLLTPTHTESFSYFLFLVYTTHTRLIGI